MTDNFVELRRAHKGYLKTFRSSFDHSFVAPYNIYNETRDQIRNILNLFKIFRLRLLICLSVLFEQLSYYFCSHCERILGSNTAFGAIDRCFNKMFFAVENFLRHGSGWKIQKINFIDLHIGEYFDIRGGSSCKTAKLPSEQNIKKPF